MNERGQKGSLQPIPDTTEWHQHSYFATATTKFIKYMFRKFNDLFLLLLLKVLWTGLPSSSNRILFLLLSLKFSTLIIGHQFLQKQNTDNRFRLELEWQKVQGTNADNTWKQPISLEQNGGTQETIHAPALILVTGALVNMLFSFYMYKPLYSGSPPANKQAATSHDVCENLSPATVPEKNSPALSISIGFFQQLTLIS